MLSSAVATALLSAYASALALLALLLGSWSAGPGFGIVTLSLLAFAATAAFGGLTGSRAGLASIALTFIGGLPAQASVLLALANGPGLLFLALPSGIAVAVTTLWLGGSLLWFAGFGALALSGRAVEEPVEFEVVAARARF